MTSEDRQAKRDRVFFEMARVISQMSTCLRAHHGAVIVNESHRVVCTGYNGSLPGEPHCDEPGVGCDIVFERRPGDSCESPHCRRTVHAERNALLQAARFGVPVDGCRIYITGEPCEECRKHLAAANVRVVQRLADSP